MATAPVVVNVMVLAWPALLTLYVMPAGVPLLTLLQPTPSLYCHWKPVGADTPPLAVTVNVVLPPVHMLVLPGELSVGSGSTVTVCELEVAGEHPDCDV